jgi:acyl-CoA thioester hydrolase
MSNETFSYPLVIQETYLDVFGHVNNAVYLNLFEEARWDFITKKGYGLNKIQESGFAPIILEIKLSFLKELRLRDEIIIQTKMISYENKIGKLSQKMVREKDLCCEAELIIGLFNLKDRKLVLPTKDWLSALGL